MDAAKQQSEDDRLANQMHYEARINALRNQKNQDIKAQQTKYSDKIKKVKSDARQRAEIKKHKASIEKNAKELYKWLIHPNGIKHVPEMLRNTVSNFLYSIDFAKYDEDGEAIHTKKSLKWQESMTKLKQEMKRIDDPKNWDEVTNTLKDIYLDIDPNFLDRLEAFFDNTQVRTLSELDADQMAELDYLVKVLKKAVREASEVIVICERIRTFSNNGQQRKGFGKKQAQGLNPNYLKMTGALVAVIVDTAEEYNVPVYSVDTRSWKSKIVGSSKAKVSKGKRDAKSQTVDFIQAKGFDLFIRTDKNGKDIFDDDAADSACICLYGFLPSSKQNLLLEE
jgi:hypothetical protein